MEIFVCKKIGCTKLGNIYSNKYALEKHFRSHSDENNLILLGKRKRDVFETPPPPEPNFNCVCVCGTHHRDRTCYDRHIEKCQVVVPTKDKLETFNYRELKVPTAEELDALNTAMDVLSPHLKAVICLNAGICIPAIFPILCNSNKGLLTSTFSDFGLVGKEGLKMLAEIVDEAPLVINEAFLITFSNGRKVFIPPSMMQPPDRRLDLKISFITTHTGGFLTISKGVEGVEISNNNCEDFNMLHGEDSVEEAAADASLLRLRGGAPSQTNVPTRVVANTNRYMHPTLWSDKDIMAKIRITKDEFLHEFCPSVIDASPPNQRQEHEAKCFLFLVKMAECPSFDQLAADFMISRQCASTWFLDILFALFLTCDYIPTIFNDTNATDQEIDSLLESVRAAQSPYVKHIVQAFRADDGRPVTLLNHDYTALLMEGMSSVDLQKQQDMHSGLRGNKAAMYVSALVDGQGKVVAIPAGGGIGKSPRGGDCAANAEILTQESLQGSHCSLTKIFQGTNNNAVLVNTDLGFVEKGSVNLGNRVTTAQSCSQHGIPHIYPFRPKDKKRLNYQPQPIHRVTIVDNSTGDQLASDNSAKVSTSLRMSVEQLFAIVKNWWKINKGRINQAFFRPLGEKLCRHYTLKHPSHKVHLDQDWYDMSLMYVIFCVSCGLVNWFSAGFGRSTSGPVEQIRLAQSVLTRLSTPNVLCDPHLGWGPSVNGVHIDIDPCGFPGSAPPGVHVTRLGDAQGMSTINIPQVQPGEGKLLREPGGGGDFCLRRGEGLLSLERHRELRDLANTGHYPNLSDYMEDVILLPESTVVQSFRQNNMPRGWPAQFAADPNFPAWVGPSTVVSMKLPSHFKNNRLPANMHTVVFLFSDQPANHNGFTGVMCHLFASWCSCQKGLRTNTMCAHRSGGMVVIMASWFFKNTVTRMYKVIDIWRHPNFQPISTGGVPEGNRDRTVLIHAFPCRPRRSEDKRSGLNQRFDPNYQAAQAQGRPNIGRSSTPPMQSPPATPSRTPTAPQQQPGVTVNHPSGLAGLLNSNNCCYVNAVVQLLTCIAAQDSLNMLDFRLINNRELLDLFETIYALCHKRQNPSEPPFSTHQLRDCFNALLTGPGIPVRFQIGRFECSLELLQEILSHVSFRNQFLVDFPVVGICPICNQQITETVLSNKMLSVALNPSSVPVNVSDVFTNRINERQHFLDFVHCHCVCPSVCPGVVGCPTAVRVQGHLSPTQGEVMILATDRSGIGLGMPANSKVLTSLAEINQLQGYNLVAVLCHVERIQVRGHWIAFVKKTVAGQPTWWKLDDCRPLINVNPFQAQCDQGRPSCQDDFTIDILVFKR